MVRVMTCLLGCVVLATAGAARADDDPIKAKLDKAKAAYEVDAEKYKAAVGEWFGKREDTTRVKGDKKAVDQVLAERKTFEEKGIIPPSISPSLVQQSATARAKVEQAYQVAVKEYIKGKQDVAAAAAVQQLDSFRRTAVGVTMAEWVRLRVVGRWRRDHDEQLFVFDADGKVSEFGRDSKPVTSGKWAVNKDGIGTVPLVSGWEFNFTLTEEKVMTASARNAQRRPEAPWGLKKIEK